MTLVGLDVTTQVATGAVRGAVLVVRVEGADPPEGVWRQAVEMGAEHVVLLPEAEEWLVRRLVDAAAPPARAPVLAVLGGCGGAGASSLAIALAVTAAAPSSSTRTRSAAVSTCRWDWRSSTDSAGRICRGPPVGCPSR